jgi:hypothetical protein
VVCDAGAIARRGHPGRWANDPRSLAPPPNVRRGFAPPPEAMTFERRRPTPLTQPRGRARRASTRSARPASAQRSKHAWAGARVLPWSRTATPIQDGAGVRPGAARTIFGTPPRGAAPRRLPAVAARGGRPPPPNLPGPQAARAGFWRRTGRRTLPGGPGRRGRGRARIRGIGAQPAPGAGRCRRRRPADVPRQSRPRVRLRCIGPEKVERVGTLEHPEQPSSGFRRLPERPAAAAVRAFGDRCRGRPAVSVRRRGSVFPTSRSGCSCRSGCRPGGAPCCRRGPRRSAR